MPKNTQGGSSHKKFARKHNLGGFNKNKLRISEDEGELYAIVTKLLGNGMFHCHCIDDTLRLGHIRGKFSGRGKRDNMVEAGKWVLIGLRETVAENWQPLDNNDISKDKFKDGGDEDGFIFSTDRDIEREKLIEDMKSVTAEKITMRIDEIVETEEEVNVDDI